MTGDLDWIDKMRRWGGSEPLRPAKEPLPMTDPDALEKLAERLEEAMARCRNDFGTDAEIGPLGCVLGEKCECVATFATLLAEKEPDHGKS